MNNQKTPNANTTVEADETSVTPLLSVRKLQTQFRTETGYVTAVDRISYDIFPDEVVGIVGESGSGKSVTALSILRLIPNPPGKIAGGEILFTGKDVAGKDLLQLSYPELRQIRGKEIAMIFQEPMTSLNPLYPIGMQIMEPLWEHAKLSKREAKLRAIEMLKKVGIADPDRRLGDYPHQFSGGMRQRVMIAMALMCNPSLLIADEPTTALDVTTQAQILELMLELKEQRKGSSILFITHDLGVVAQMCQRVIVMYGGKVQEIANVKELFANPQHPYTRGLLASLPAAPVKNASSQNQRAKKQKRLNAIPGNVPQLSELPTGCKFSTRCSEVMERCHQEEPLIHQINAGHQVRCHLVEEKANE